MPQNFGMLYGCHCVLKTLCETTDRRSKQQQQKYMLLGVTAAATSVIVVVAVFFARPLFHSYIATSVHLFIHHLSAYKE